MGIQQIGIPDYQDVFNREKISKINDLMVKLNMYYSKLVNKSSIENRESDKAEVYIHQYQDDMYYLKKLRELNSEISDFCDNALFTILSESIYSHNLKSQD